MRKNLMILLMSTVLTATPAISESITQVDIDAGAIPLTTSQITSVITNNTAVGENWCTYYPEGKKRILWYNEKTYKSKWKVDKEKGWCIVDSRSKKWKCWTLWQIGPRTYRAIHVHKEGEEVVNFDIEEGNIYDL